MSCRFSFLHCDFGNFFARFIATFEFNEQSVLKASQNCNVSMVAEIDPLHSLLF